MRFSRLAPAVVGLALVAGACGDSTGSGSTVELSQADADALFEAVGTVLDGLDFNGSFRTAGTPPGLSLSSVGAVPIDESGSCPGGGTVSLDGNTSEGQTGFSWDLDLGFNSCQSDGHTINGTLDYTGSGEFGGDFESFDFSFSINGSLNVTLPDARSGVCVFDIDANFNGESGSVSGKICGQSVSDNF